ncbi:MAG: DEAD/DEAH box helicase [Cyanobacteria bacterium REEB67]|nr:DEAD/DEAH box helicase [Cyanobacteria bacterium REEB67]
MTDKLIGQHLAGEYTLGVYPLLMDNTCWFLAIDFDKADWQSDVLAFAETCDRHMVPAHIERSRSGNGGHIWIFFERPVAASRARNLGAFLISETKQSRYQLAFSSYDRMFPNQDLMPSGGFGNLIAYPLQKAARSEGNSVFVDRSLRPYENQWQYLSSVQKVSASQLDTLVSAASQRDAIFQVPLSSSDENSDEPWKNTFKKVDQPIILKAPLPKSVIVVQSDMLYVPKDGFGSAALSSIANLAAFQNPEFYKKQSLRQSTHDTPRVICCGEDLAKYIAIPRGCNDAFEKLCTASGVNVKYTDERNPGRPISTKFTQTLRPKQQEAADSLAKFEIGILSASTAFGKTVVAAEMISRRKTNTLILVHTVAIIEQWRERLQQFLELPPKSIGQIGGGKKKPTGVIDIATIQSLVRNGEVAEVVADYGHVIVDECHHLSAFSFEKVIKRAKAKYVLGLTATPVRKDGHQPIIMMHCGPIRFKHSTKEHMQASGIKYTVHARETKFKFGSSSGDVKMHELYEALAKDEERNELIFNDILLALSAKRSPLVLTERVEHLDGLAARLKNFAKNLIVLKGGMKKKERAAVMDQLSKIQDGEERVILATGKYVGEGFDDARLDTLFLLLPISIEGRLEQYAGRLLRDQPGKAEVQIFDYTDLGHPILARMYEKRRVKYRKLGYEIVFGGN